MGPARVRSHADPLRCHESRAFLTTEYIYIGAHHASFIDKPRKMGGFDIESSDEDESF